MNFEYELERIWKEAVMAVILLEELRNMASGGKTQSEECNARQAVERETFRTHVRNVTA
jgi:hypothetical protein